AAHFVQGGDGARGQRRMARIRIGDAGAEMNAARGERDRRQRDIAFTRKANVGVPEMAIAERLGELRQLDQLRDRIIGEQQKTERWTHGPLTQSSSWRTPVRRR